MQTAYKPDNWHSSSETTHVSKPDLEATEEMRDEGGGNGGQESFPYLKELWHYITLINIPKNRAYIERIDYMIMKSSQKCCSK